MAYPASEPVEEIGSAWRETRNFCSRDQWIRSHGYRIHSRPRLGPTLWEAIEAGVPFGCGKPIPQSTVEARCEQTDRAAKRKAT